MSKTISSLYYTHGVPAYVAGIDPITILPGAGYIDTASTAMFLTAGAPWYLINAGILDGPNGHGLVADGSPTTAVTVLNSGTIVGNFGVAIGGSAADLLVNTGYIGGTGAFGVALNSGTLVNAGTIVGSLNAVSVTPFYATTVIAEPGAVFRGSVYSSYGVNRLGNTYTAASVLAFAAGTGAGGVGTFSGLGTQYGGFWTIDVAAGAVWIATGTNNLIQEFQSRPGWRGLDVLGTLNNTGTLLTGMVGQTVTITKTIGLGIHTYIMDIDNLTVAGSGGELVNSGLIGGTTASIPVYVQGGQVSNAAGGTIEGMIGIALSAGGTLLDAGTISAPTGSGVSISGTYKTGQTSAIVVQPHGSISGIAAGILSGEGVYTTNITVDAGGTVEGGNFGIDFPVGFFLPPQVVNAGAILGGGAGIRSFSGIVTNSAGGLIQGATGVLGAQTVVNAGTIVATAGDAVALDVVSGARLVVDPGAVFAGVAVGNTLGANLEFAAGATGGVFAGLGSQYQTFASTTIDRGATWTADGANTLRAGYTLFDRGALTIAGTLAGAGEVSLGAGVVLDVAGTGSLGAATTGLGQGTIELSGVVASYGALGGGMLTLTGGPTLAVPGLAQVRVTQTAGNTYITACFAAGTRIQGEFGPVPVEALRAGGRVLAASGRLAPVKWLGHRRTDLARHKRPHDVMPVRVRAGAFADGAPSRDLVLSPDHAVFIDGHLVPVRHLVNGASIVQETRAAITYWHVELDRHDILLAEDLACESYLDTGNRCAFENAPGAVAMTPDFTPEHVARAVWTAQGCAPILTDPADPRLRALHLRLLARSQAGVPGPRSAAMIASRTA